MIVNNVNYFIDFYRIKISDLSNLSGVSEPTISRIRNEKYNIGKNVLRKLARAFSEISGIPYEIFEDGQALLTKDFSKIEVQSLQSTPDTEQAASTREALLAGMNSGGLKITPHELYLIEQLRRSRASLNLPLPSDTCNKISAIYDMLNGNDSGLDSIIGMLRVYRGFQNETRQTEDNGG